MYYCIEFWNVVVGFQFVKIGVVGYYVEYFVVVSDVCCQIVDIWMVKWGEVDINDLVVVIEQIGNYVFFCFVGFVGEQDVFWCVYLVFFWMIFQFYYVECFGGV